MSNEVDVEKAVRFLHQNGLSVEVGYDAEQELVAMRAVDVKRQRRCAFRNPRRPH
jgi:hypothetical protein